MKLISVCVDELRRAAGRFRDLAVGDAPLHPFRVAGQSDLTLAVAEFVGCMNDCAAERRHGVEALATGLREVADLFENMDAGARDDVRALGASREWAIG